MMLVSTDVISPGKIFMLLIVYVREECITFLFYRRCSFLVKNTVEVRVAWYYNDLKTFYSIAGKLKVIFFPTYQEVIFHFHVCED